MYEQDTTIKSRGPLSKVGTDLQAARNEFAVAMRKYFATQTKEARDAMDTAQAKVFQLEDVYRDGYWKLLEHACSKQGWKR